MSKIAILVIVLIISSTAAQNLGALTDNENEESGLEVDKKDLSDSNIAFDLPDLTSIIETSSGAFQLEAYKSVNNDRIIRNVSNEKVSQLFWVSVGQPTLVKKKSPSNRTSEKIFHSSNYGFTTYIDMLTTAHRNVLLSTVNKKYHIKVDVSQIVNLILSKFECLLTMYDENGKKYLLKGNVFDFRHFPLRMNFQAPLRSAERRVFLLQDESDLDFMCTMASTGKLMKTNTLTISGQQQQLIGIEEKLFGPATTDKSKEQVYVTRDQMTDLSSEMYTTLNIVEDYQMSEGQFSDAFVEGMINQIATDQFKHVPIDTVLASLSKYGFDVGQDLKPDVVKRDMGSIMNVETKDGKSRIVVDETNYSTFEKTYSKSRGAGASAFGINGSANWGKSNSESSSAYSRSINDQLYELNTLSRQDVQWDIVGNKVIPKSLNVARLSRTKLGTTLSFNRVRVQSFVAPFDRQFAIHTNRAAAAISIEVGLSSRITTVEADVKKMDTRLSASIKTVESQLTTSIQSVSTRALKRCRLCFTESSGFGVCKGNRNSCTPFTDSTSVGGWTQPFIDDTDHTYGWCTYQWAIHCYV